MARRHATIRPLILVFFRLRVVPKGNVFPILPVVAAARAQTGKTLPAAGGAQQWAGR